MLPARPRGGAPHGRALTTGAVELLKDVLLACACPAQQLALTRVVHTIAATHGALRGPMTACGTQAGSSLPIGGGCTGAAEAAGHVGAGVPGPCAGQGGNHTGCLPAPHLAHPPPCTFPYHRARGGAGGFAAAGGTVRAAAHTHCCRWRRLSHTLVPRRQGRRSSCTHRRPGLDPLHWAHRLRQSHTAFPCTLWLGTGRGGQSQGPGLGTAAAPTGTSPQGCAACSSPHTATSVMGALLCTFTGPGPLEGAPASPGTFPHWRTFSIPLAGEGPPAPQ